ncbi:sensor histidine kinase [Nocardia pneumoniae]|uniref:sensor histidine kinase n=1 Tax=Nocardia pneumoniae TaxID=228601 RepID=UPI0002E7F6FA|nr:sensor histidine kinase [Nocardia pneumoniae]
MTRTTVGRLTAQGWLQLVLAVMVLLVIVGAIAGGQVIAHTNRVTDRLLSQTMPAAAEAYRLESALVNQETGLRGYAIAADSRFLEPYDEGKREQERAAARLRELLADRPDRVADVEAVERAAQRWRAEYADPLAATVTTGATRPVETSTALRGKAVFDQVRAASAAQRDNIAAEVARGNEELAHARTVRSVVLSGLIATILLTGVVLTVLIRRLVARPLGYLTESSRRVADGDFDHRIDAHGPADLSLVAEAVEDMRRRIVAELGAYRAQQALLEQQKADLDFQAEELRRSNAELEQFAYVASHDLQEPLRKVASFCQLLEKRYGAQLDERGKQYIDFAVDGAKRMQVLINDLLTFSRVGRISEGIEPTRLDRPLHKALTNLASAIEDSGATIELPDELPEIVGEPTLLVMLWQNLIGNAVKFRKPDVPPVVRIDCERATEEPEGWQFSVTDNGIGIAPEFAEKVFVIFQRLHGRDEYSGTGIGLALCKKIVEYHGGRIWIDTDHREGTRLCFTLQPVESASTESSPITEGASSV